jgi:hypothetical protein
MIRFSFVIASLLVLSNCGWGTKLKSEQDMTLLNSTNQAKIEDLSKKDWAKNSDLTEAPLAIHPKGCEWFQCEISPDYELGLEKEFWRHLQQEDKKGMAAWLTKTKQYLDHPSHKLGSHDRDDPHARLMLLVALGHSHQLALIDLEPMASIIAQLTSGDVISMLTGVSRGVAQIPVSLELEEAIRWGFKAYNQAKEPIVKDKALMALMSVGVFIQGMSPEFLGITGPKATMATIFGPSCQEMPNFLRNQMGPLCTERGLIGPDYKTCQDTQSCKQVGNGMTETFAGAVLALSKMHDLSKVQKMLEIAGDSPDSVALCKTFWCRNLNPSDKKDPQPERSSLTPFKRVVNLLMIAEAYGKVGQEKRMEIVLKEAFTEAKRLNYPFLNQLTTIYKALHGGEGTTPDILKRWKNFDPKKDALGMLQVPFPMSATIKPCASCHFGGVLPQATLDLYR